jgi:hypothetical protein
MTAPLKLTTVTLTSNVFTICPASQALLIHVTRFIDTVDNGSISKRFIYSLSMIWRYYMNVMFIFLLYNQDLRKCCCKSRSTVDNHSYRPSTSSSYRLHCICSPLPAIAHDRNVMASNRWSIGFNDRSSSLPLSSMYLVMIPNIPALSSVLANSHNNDDDVDNADDKQVSFWSWRGYPL